MQTENVQCYQEHFHLPEFYLKNVLLNELELKRGTTDLKRLFDIESSSQYKNAMYRTHRCRLNQNPKPKYINCFGVSTKCVNVKRVSICLFKSFIYIIMYGEDDDIMLQ